MREASPLERPEEAHPDEILKWAFDTFGSGMVLGTGFGPSGIVLIHRLQYLQLPVTVFYINTHLLFDETYALCDKIEKRFNISIIRVESRLSLQEQARQYGEKLWETDVDLCCHLRKVVPLRNYLADKTAWITGIRRDQSETRKQTKIIGKDPEYEVVKINPLAYWSRKKVWEYIHMHDLPYNPLHDHGYPSIGCVPCTEKVEPGEEERAGRWRGSAKTECGIHVSSRELQGEPTK
ncbi:MAG TPA: phosphoadenylyl-sulfate reductase [Balneolaceae bacterium]|nr:phosphoadenylyl-sulfate reductase [Balneolaceae bacterium]